MQTYIIALPILLGYIVWLLQEQKKKQVQDAKERDERIAEERKKRDANSAGTMLLLSGFVFSYDCDGVCTLSKSHVLSKCSVCSDRYSCSIYRYCNWLR